MFSKLPTLPTLTGERVRLRWLTHDDIDGLFRIFSSPQVTQFWSWDAYQDRAQAAALLEEIQSFFHAGSLFQWGLERLEDQRLIGTCTLAGLASFHDRGEVGFAQDPAAWGQGYMQEALGLLLPHAFETMKLRRLEADTDPQNHRALRLFERLGFQREGYLRERWWLRGRPEDAVVLGLLKREWLARSSSEKGQGANASEIPAEVSARTAEIPAEARGMTEAPARTSAMTTEVLRLHPQEDLKEGLVKWCRERAVDAGCVVTCVGSLQKASLRLAGAKEAVTYEGPLEIVSLVGTLSQAGCHLHIGLSDGKGAMVGGHVMEGCLIYTTGEIVVGIFPALRFEREIDPQTGYRELQIHSGGRKREGE